jgi:hypothetical protein
MKFYEFNETEKRLDVFNERWYPINGKWYRNVTTILQIIDKGYAYDEWLKQTGYNSEIIVDRAGKLGSGVHKLAEQTLLGETVKYFDLGLPEEQAVAYWERYLRWASFWKEFSDKITYKPGAVEFICHSKKHEYAGTIDLLCNYDKELTIFDWKTGTSVHEEAYLQMSAYAKAIEEMFGTPVQKAIIVHIPFEKPNKKGYRLHEIGKEEIELYFKKFLSAKELHDWKNKEKPRFLSYPLELNLEEITKSKTIIKEK